jgi:hypothetical protein
VGYVNNCAKLWVWRLKSQSEPEPIQDLMERAHCALSGDDRCRCLLSIASTVKEGENYIECCAEKCELYSGDIQILVMPRPSPVL